MFSRRKRAAKTRGETDFPAVFFSGAIPREDFVKIARLIGAAGSGKTTELLRIMEGALPQLGGDPMRLGFASFTRAARAEAVGRASAAWGVPPSLLEKDGWFRTVHSTCKRCLGVSGGELITNSQKDTKWVSEVLGVRLSTELDDESGRHRFIGDPVVAGALNCWSLSLASLTPLEEVVRRIRMVDDAVPDYAAIVRIADKYETAKRAHGRADFTDLLLRFAGLRASPTSGIAHVTPEGELPKVDAWLFDEQQDASPLLDFVCKRLVSAPSVKWCYVVGDPFQAIYGFAGSSADCFLGWPADKQRIMPKSYRCPAPILELGERCLRRMKKGYFNRNVAPADHEGTVREMSSVEDAACLAKPNEDWLFIARTNYHASRMFATLQSMRKPCRWAKTAEGASARAEGLRALYALEKDEPITGTDWARAIALVPLKNKAGTPMLARGVKTRWAGENADRWDHVFLSDLTGVGAQPALVEAIRSGEWCGLVDGGEVWRKQAVEHGPALAAEPRIRVGTIHSVKGAEADNVAFLTSVSQKTERAMEDQLQADEEHRVAYVAVTRAKRALYVITEGKGGRRVPCLEVL